ncbi:autotransporter assembly complex family protein [uncultured Cohaesibacter sp.]|uniref:autotransporter assembly complex protein TamA n=1 Tax=uncultured Cohaesibacter sp. TaxID=1002546 RepID=UPI002930A9A4|nr:autotransporter assembly complex family protein [uncultured Cohaesibacter sp.]
MLSWLPYQIRHLPRAEDRDARRRCALAIMGLAVSCIFFTLSSEANAFDLFGYSFSSDGIKKVSETKPTADIPDPISYKVNLSSSDEELTETFEAASLLIEKQEEPASGTSGLLLRANSDQKRLIAALYQQGFYGGTVDIMVNGVRYDKIALDKNLRGSEPVTIDIAVTAGDIFTFSKPDASLADGTALDLNQYGIEPGKPAYSQLILDAETEILADYHEKGYALAQIDKRALEADHKTGTLDVTMRVSQGPIARFGQVTVTGNKNVDSDFIIQQANIPQGEIYHPQAIAKANRNLRVLNVFDSVIIKPASAIVADGSLPIEISVKERKFRTIGAGVTMGNLDGVGIEGYWVHRNLFGGAESLRVEGSVGNIGQDDIKDLDYNAAIIFAKPGIIGPASKFTSKLATESTNSDAFEKRSVSGQIGLSYQWTDALSTSTSFKAEFARITDSSGTDSNLLFSTPIELEYDKRDSKLDPTKGFYLLLATEPTINSDASVSFVKTSATLSAYQALDKAKRFVLAGKLSAGSILGASKSDIPTDRRFFTGGGGSIRGYSYQMVGPRDSDNAPTGGRSYVTASLEGRIKITDTIGLAAFVDTGNTFNSAAPKFNQEWYTGVGAGIRYLTPIGPLRLDVAIPLKEIKDQPGYGVYIGLGQAF